MSQSHTSTPHQRIDNGLHLFAWSQRLAHVWGRATLRRLLPPSGARIFYYTRLALLRIGVEPPLEPTHHPLPRAVVTAFLQAAPTIATHLSADFPLVVRLLSDPTQAGPQLLATHPTPRFAGLADLLAALEQPGQASADPLATWGQYWTALAALPHPIFSQLLTPERVRVAPVARPQDVAPLALGLLVARLAQDEGSPFGRRPPADAYLYEEPFLHWFARSLLTQVQLSSAGALLVPPSPFERLTSQMVQQR
jgi:hypothetical protein